MSEEPTPPYVAGTVTAPPGWNDAPGPKRGGSRSLLPSTWLGQAVRLGYVGVDGKGVESTGTLLDWCGAGPVFSLSGGRVLVAWDRIVSLELVSD